MATISLELEAEMVAKSAWLRDRAATIAIAREDPVTFCAFVLRDELTGEPIAIMPMHEEMHDAVTKNDRVVMWAHFESGKTTQISIGRVLFELGLNPNLRVAIVSRASKGAKKIIRAISGYIERSRELHAVFPELVRSREAESVWSSEAITVKRSVISKDPSVQACGYHGQVVGSRIDFLIVDDILDAETTATPEQRENVTKWVESSLFTRITQDARVVIVGNAWHEDDTMHKCVEDKGYTSLRFPIYVGNDNGISWPGKWTEKRIAQSRRDLGAIEFARKMLCISRNDEMQRFKQAWIDIACEQGVGFELVKRIVDPSALPPGYGVITGVDLSTGEGKDYSTFVTVLLHPDGRVQLLNVEAHRITGPEIVDKIDEIFDRYGGIIVVENNGSQRFILQFSKKLTDAIVWPYTTGKNKADPIFGIEGIAVELQRGDWILPCELIECAGGPSGQVTTKKPKRFDLDPEIDTLVREMLFYDPRKHTGDRLMGLFFAREACVKIRAMRKRGQSGQGSSLTVIGGDEPGDDPAASDAPGMRRAVGA